MYKKVSHALIPAPKGTGFSDYKVDKLYNWFIKNKNKLITGFLGLIAVLCLLWVFIPITKDYIVKGFEWEREIDLEEYKLCHENDWTVPPGAEITDRRQEIHHFNHIIDHYATKTRQVSHRVQDGYDISYRDLGNGQFNEVRTPRYRTEYETETYQEPVYREKPVYQTKYYYDIGRWKRIDTLKTSNNDKNPYWYETDIPADVNNPNYGDKRLGNHRETYTLVVTDDKEREKRFKYNFDEWNSFEVGQTIQHKAMRFS